MEDKKILEFLKTEEIRTPEEYIKDVNSMYEQVIAKYNANEELYEKCNKAVADITHEIELGNKRDIVKGYKLYEMLRTVLIARRKAADENVLLKDLYVYLEGSQGANKHLSNLLGSIATKRSKLETRKYSPKALPFLEFTLDVLDGDN